MKCFLKDIVNTSILAALMLASAFSLFAQNSGNESFYLHLNQPFYVTGETIWYTAYNTNFKAQQDHSDILYLNLHDKSGALVKQQKQKILQGVACGSMEIPLSFDEDYYYLTCFTNWSLQFDNAPTCVQIPIFNPYGETPYSTMADDQLDSTLNESAISIQLKKDSFSRRETVQVKLDAKEFSAISMTVHALQELGVTAKSVGNVSYQSIQTETKEKSLMIEGLITDPESGVPVTSNVICIYRVGSNQFIETSSLEGSIEIQSQDFEGAGTFQIFNMNPYQATTPKFKLNISGVELNGIRNSTLKRNPAIERYLKDILLKQKVSEIFYSEKKDSLLMRSFQPIDFNPDKVYLMEKYHQMSTFEEFLREVVYLAKVKKVDDQLTVRLKNTETTREFMEKPWYLVDGYLTRDEEAVLAIPFKSLKRVELYNTNKSILGQLQTTMIRSGLIVIYTSNNHKISSIEASENIFQLTGFATSNEYAPIEVHDVDPKENPTFRHVLFWNPHVEQQETIQFTTSDLMGEYLVEVTGVSNDGQILSGSKRFTVGY